MMAIETGGMFDRLVENGFDESARCGLIHLKGQPARSTRRIMKKNERRMGLADRRFHRLRSVVVQNIRIHVYGAIKTAHISEYLATPSAIYLGIDSDDIKAYDLPSDELTSRDIEALKAEKE